MNIKMHMKWRKGLSPQQELPMKVALCKRNYKGMRVNQEQKIKMLKTPLEITEETMEVIIRGSMSWIQFLSGLVPKLWVILIREKP